MALFNKLFTSRKGTQTRNQDNVSEKLFAFSKDQVRVVLFRECDFRGRKLLFDSSCVKKVPFNPSEFPKTKENERFSEVSDGFGYIYTKPQPDFNQVAEMVFGSVAMSFRGNYFKIHVLESPDRLMFTQVFSSPRHINHGRISVSSRSEPLTLEHSNKLDDSGASSTNSMSEQLSVRSTTSDTVLVCRRHRSRPLDVPSNNLLSNSNPSLIGDSGYCADHSNISSGPASTWGSITTENGNSTLSLSSNSLFKKMMRRNSTSLDNSGVSLPSLGSTPDGFASRGHHRASKLGLSIILQLTSEREDELSQFLMEHVCLLEAMLWRARHVVEMAYLKSHNFTSMMVEMAEISAQYLVNLLSGSYLSMNLWLSLSSGCDNFNSISAFSGSSDIILNGGDVSLSGLLDKTEHSVPDFALFNLSKLLRSDWDRFNFKKSFFGEQRNLTAGKFVQEFCELLETEDVKDTNFFISTLVTAVLTHHLGWVNTCLPQNKNLYCEYDGPFNSLWGELSDLYGAVGHPTKMAQTIITGTARKDLVSKILVTMTYFIRCCDVHRRVPIRAEIKQENRIVEEICQTYSCIPKENYKTYDLREIMNSNAEFFKHNNNSPSYKNLEENIELIKCLNEDKPIPKKSKGLQKTKTCNGNLNDLDTDGSLYSDMNGSDMLFPNFRSDEVKKKSLTRVSSKTGLEIVENDVVFVLGENEKLVGLRKETVKNPDETLSTSSTTSSTKERPTYLNLDLSQTKINYEDTGDFKDSDFIENYDDPSLLKPSTSWTSLCNKKILDSSTKVEDGCRAGSFARSQSVPPEEAKIDELDHKLKYRYSGVKFNLQQYPQILSNYMKSKNLEISNLQFGEKGLKIDELSSLSDTINAKYPSFDPTYDDSEALQTPSNASELEFTSDLFVAPPVQEQAKETTEKVALTSTFVKQHVPNTIIKEFDFGNCNERKISSLGGQKMNVVNFPMPKSHFLKPFAEPIRYTSSLMRAPSENYMPGMVLQGPTASKRSWEFKLKSDLALSSQHSLIDQPIEEAVAIIANTDSWEVQLMSSHTFVIDKGSSGIRVGMSQLVANMLESLLQMWKLNVPPHFCLLYIEQTLQELYVRSKALAELLLATEFCSMEKLTSTLQLEVNDVPLLLAVASTHTPQVTEKYGLSFQ